ASPAHRLAVARVRPRASACVHLSDLRVRSVARPRLWSGNPRCRGGVRAHARRSGARAERVRAESPPDRVVRDRRLRGDEPIHEQTVVSPHHPTTEFSRAGLANTLESLAARAHTPFVERLFDELHGAYSATDRHYHGVRHIAECLRALRDVRAWAE